MNASRIEIEATSELPAPHFDDEATIVSARPVVPIAQAKAAERSRVIRWVLPFVLAGVVVGILAELAITRYENRQHSEAEISISEPQKSQTDPKQASQTENAADPANVERNSSKDDANSAAGLPEQPASTTQGKSPAAASDTASQANTGLSRDSSSSAKAHSTVDESSATSRDPGRLVRKRRVRPLIERNEANPYERKSPSDRRSPSRILEIFQGHNP